MANWKLCLIDEEGGVVDSVTLGCAAIPRLRESMLTAADCDCCDACEVWHNVDEIDYSGPTPLCRKCAEARAVVG